MALKLKHSSNIRPPDIKKIQDPITQAVLEQFSKLVSESFRNIYDDLVRAATDRVDTLPTAGSDYLGRLMLKTNSGADDTLHICRFKGATSTYEWVTVTVS